MNNRKRNTYQLSDGKLFAGEKLLVIISIIGFLLAVGIALYIGMYGAIVSPEGDLERAFSFNAAMAMFVLTIAAILPLSEFSLRKRTAIRWGFILTTLYSYSIETIQHFRGINPRFSTVGTAADTIAGALFGLVSLIIIILTVIVAIPFFQSRIQNERPLLKLGIRYAFISIMIAFGAGIWMIALQSRYTGDAGNLIVLHGIGFHALQALPLIGWLLERADIDKKRAKFYIHAGSAAWISAILLIGVQTVLGRTVFELAPLPILAGAMLIGWLIIVMAAAYNLLKRKTASDLGA